MQIRPWGLSTAAGYGLVCGGKETSWSWPRVPDRRKGLVPYSSAFDGGASVVCKRLAFMSYHDVFIWFICTVNESYKKCHEVLYFFWGKQYCHKQLVEKQSCTTRKRLFDGLKTFFRFFAEKCLTVGLKRRIKPFAPTSWPRPKGRRGKEIFPDGKKVLDAGLKMRHKSPSRQRVAPTGPRKKTFAK